MSDESTAIYILAAGASRRLGQPKQLVPYPDGGTLLSRVFGEASSACPNVFVILGSRAGLVQKEACIPAHRILINDRWEEGMGSSVRLAGLDAQRRKWRAIVLAVADQPFLTGQVLSDLLEADEELMASCYQNGVVGTPVRVGFSNYELLSESEGDAGLRRIFRHQLDLSTVEFPRGNFDVDSPGDMERLFRAKIYPHNSLSRSR